MSGAWVGRNRRKRCGCEISRSLDGMDEIEDKVAEVYTS